MINETDQIQYHSLEEAIHSVFGNDASEIRRERVHGGDINDAYRLSLSTGEKVFVKTNSINNWDFFRTESHSLLALRGTETIGVPKVLGTGIDEQKGFSFLLLEWMERVPPVKNYWEIFGHELAALHRAEYELHPAKCPLRAPHNTCPSEADVLCPAKYTLRAPHDTCPSGASGLRPARYGFVEDNFIGSNPQKNSPMETWIDFYRECRLTPQIRMAEHYLDSKMRKKIAHLLDHLDSYLREPAFPSLLHGDLWSGNVLCGNDGKAWILDPAAYVGDFETDLAMTQLFGSFPYAFYSAYSEINPIDKRYEERRDLYHLYHLLNHLNLFGRMYLGSVTNILNRYV